jgi:hypothetical protein
MDAEIDKAASVIARKCRAVIQSLLLDSERHDCDEEFRRIALEVMRELAIFKGGK